MRRALQADMKIGPILPSARRALTGTILAPLSSSPIKVFSAFLFVIIHIPLALLLDNSSLVATTHAALVFAFGIYSAVRGHAQQVAYVGAYIVGAEVLWRMSKANVFWEFGKYALVAIFLLTLLRIRRTVTPTLALMYFALLLPSAVLLLKGDMDISEIRDQLSFNLSGPLALAVSAYFFSNIKLSRADLIKLFISLIGPVIGIAAIAFYGISTTEIAFSDNSNIEASGGYGPNQVSTILGLGALLLLFCLFDERVGFRLKLLLLAGIMLLGIQSAMTFSRGGLYNAAGAALAASFYLLRDTRSRVIVLVGGAVIILAAQFVIIPRLDAMTGGALTERFQDTGMTGRDDLMSQDIQIWLQNPVLGVGPGEAMNYRLINDHNIAAHTEYTRLLSEHGVFGLVALGLLLAAGVRNLFNCRDHMQKGLALAFICWSLIFMIHAGMRLAAPSFMFGLAFAMPHVQALAQRRPRRQFRSSARLRVAGKPVGNV